MLNLFFFSTFNMYGITELNIVPVRAEHKEQSEQITQLLFGETFIITEKKGSWFKINSTFDKYTGWIDNKLCTIISEETYTQINNSPKTITNEIITIAFKNNEKTPNLILSGSYLPFYNSKTKTFSIGENIYHLESEIENNNNSDIRQNIIKTAKQYLNSPYLWGGRTQFGIDCSGFSQIVLKINNINIPRDASQQVNSGKTVNIIYDIKPGDLAFFDNSEGKIIHVGILISNDKIIHASGKVRIDKIDHQGIYNSEIKKYTHNLRVVQNIID